MYVQRNGCAKMHAIHRWWQINLCFAFAIFNVGFRFFLLLFLLYKNVFSEHFFLEATMHIDLPLKIFFILCVFFYI